MSERRVGQAERRLERKMDKVRAGSHGGNAGRSIIEGIDIELDQAMVRYKNLGVDLGMAEDSDARAALEVKRAMARGVVRGLAIARAMYTNPTAPDPVVQERLSLRRVQDGIDS